MSNLSMIIPFKKKSGQYKYLLKNEFIPGWDLHPDTCGISLEATETRERDLVELMKKELNLVVDESELFYLGVCAIKRNSDHVCYLYSLDLSRRDFEIEKEDQEYFWSDAEKLVESIDPQLLSGFAKLKYQVLE